MSYKLTLWGWKSKETHSKPHRTLASGRVCVFEYERGLYPLSGVRLPGFELHVWVPGEDWMQPDGFKCKLSD